MLARLGAEVIQVEPPEGSPARRRPPFHPDWPAGEDSFFWVAYAAPSAPSSAIPAARRAWRCKEIPFLAAITRTVS